MNRTGHADSVANVFIRSHTNKSSRFDIADRKKNFYLSLCAVSLLNTIGGISLMIFHQMKKNQTVSIGLGMFTFTTILFIKHRYWLNQYNRAFNNVRVYRGRKSTTAPLIPREIELTTMGRSRNPTNPLGANDEKNASSSEEQRMPGRINPISAWITTLNKVTDANYAEVMRARLNIPTQKSYTSLILHVGLASLLLVAAFFERIKSSLAISGIALLSISAFKFSTKPVPPLPSLPPDPNIARQCSGRLSVESKLAEDQKTLTKMLLARQSNSSNPLSAEDLLSVFKAWTDIQPKTPIKKKHGEL